MCLATSLLNTIVVLSLKSSIRPAAHCSHGSLAASDDCLSSLKLLLAYGLYVFAHAMLELIGHHIGMQVPS
ncbi:hypothetical protein VNO78_22489 [Psophocarpus tetragonolobus]|uniref:Uncharacterized protein n=1 Tax=Psophocarpus tetragonolobus TaxID=3891 RepID=A0AAN9S4S0_PSOTE